MRLGGLALAAAVAAVPTPARAQQPSPAAGARVAPVTPGAPVTPAQFRALRWLQGTWRGRMADGTYFYERYVFVDDSTVAVTFLADSTLARVTRTDSIMLRGGEVRYDGATARRVSPAGIAFGYGADTTRGFTFTPVGRGWTATIRGSTRDGRPRRTVYQMARVTL